MEKDERILHYKRKKKKPKAQNSGLKSPPEVIFLEVTEDFFFFKLPSSFLCPELFPLFALTLFVSVSSGSCLHRLWLFYLFIFLSSECFGVFFLKSLEAAVGNVHDKL